MNGVLVVDKPAGPTSHDVVMQLRKTLKQKKIGHTGTLDPVATGVLPLVIGEATKLARYLTGGDKTYRAVIRLGVTTTTLDAEGEVVEERPVQVSEADVRAVLPAFTGDIEQIPPMYSAKKMQGTRLYELARQGIEVEREPKRVTVHKLELVAARLPDIEIEVRCSAGTYVRVLAQDIGARLGCGGHLIELRRTAAGPFTLADAVPLDDVVRDPQAATRILPIGQALSSFSRLEVPGDVARMIRDGHQLTVGDLRSLDLPTFAAGQLVVVYNEAGDVVAITEALLGSTELSSSRRDRRALKTERVFLARP